MTSLKKYYNQKALNYRSSNKRAKNILKLLEKVSGKKVLDIGCANGYLGKKVLDKGNYVVGVDISEKAVKNAEKILNKVLVLDVENEKFPFKEDTFDIIICSEVIEHLFEPNEFLKKIHKLLKKDGQLIITTPNFLYWGHRLKFLRGNFQYKEEGPFDRGHIHFYTYKNLVEDLKLAKFKIKRENHVYPGSFLLNFIKNKFPGIFAYQLVLMVKK